MPTPLTPSTLIYGFTSAGDPQVSPDGRHIAYVVSQTDGESKRTTSHLWLCGIDGGGKRQLTRSGQRNGSPRWSPDGTQLAFTSDRSGKQGLYVLDMGGGEAREVLTQAKAINGTAWSPDGTRLAFTSEWDPANPSGEPAKDGAAPVRVTSRIDYKQDVLGYLGDVRQQVFVVDVASGKPQQVTTDLYTHTNPAWSPDGTQLCVHVAFNNGMTSKLMLVDAAGGSEPLLFGPEGGSTGTWSWSSDGGRIVYTADPGGTSQADFYVYDVAANNSRRITTDLQCAPDSGFAPVVPPSQPVWLNDDEVLFHAIHRGASGLWSIGLTSGDVQQVEGEQELRTGFSVDKSVSVIVQGIASLEAIGEVGVVSRAEGRRTLITGYSAGVFAESPPAGWERFDVTRTGFTTEAWLLKPPGFDPSKKYPLVLDIHGGPNGSYGYGFNAIQQVLASNGFVVVYSNPRGSTGYGREFTSQVFGDWGGEDYLDLMAVVDKALEQPYIDAARTGVYGYSYGGYMTARIISQNHRFKAAVCGAPCFDLESMYGTSDIAHHFGGAVHWTGKPHEAREWYATHSPSQQAHNTRTPTLIIHGEADERCPIGQGEQMFVTLKKNGCDVEFARYPGASHLFMRLGPPEHREDVLARVLGWFQGRLGGPE
ncbi:hypothetical protein AYO38_06115 [bacterium SCGC AG-212-C10]|nr:hypothetical protein AYO38_06115 [bacterium SCGC AG-212-C10]